MKNFLSIKLDNVSKGFEGKTVIDQITCEFKNKEVHVILGKSGTGKSVLLKMIMGLFKPELGRILIDNKDLNQSVEAIRKKCKGVSWGNSCGRRIDRSHNKIQMHPKIPFNKIPGDK